MTGVKMMIMMTELMLMMLLHRRVGS